jgi:hypothetical protein
VLSRILTILILTLACGASRAQAEPAANAGQTEEGAASGGFLQAPTVEPSPVAGEAVEPEITITESGGETVYEYRVRGTLYMVRVQPQVGPSYYFYDLDGNGLIDAQERSARNTSVPQWVLFRWN